MPGDGFAFAVEVCRQKDLVRAGGQALQLAYHLLFAGNHLIGCFPAGVGIHAHPLHELRAGPLLAVLRTLGGRQLADLRRLLGALRGTLLRIDGLSAHRQIPHVAGA